MSKRYAFVLRHSMQTIDRPKQCHCQFSLPQNFDHGYTTGAKSRRLRRGLSRYETTFLFVTGLSEMKSGP